MSLKFEEGFMAGYDKGFRNGYMEAAQDRWCSENVFHDGYEQEAYNDGYIDGVADARVCPEEADEYVAGLCHLDEADEAPTYDNYDDFAGGYDPEYGWVNSCAYDFDDLEPKVNARVEGFQYGYPTSDGWDAETERLRVARAAF